MDYGSPRLLPLLPNSLNATDKHHSQAELGASGQPRLAGLRPATSQKPALGGQLS